MRSCSKSLAGQHCQHPHPSLIKHPSLVTRQHQREYQHRN
jgi:hypothetical protein